MTCLSNKGFIHAVQGTLQVSQGASGGGVRFFEEVLLEVGGRGVTIVAAAAHGSER